MVAVSSPVSTTRAIYRFGAFELVPDTLELRRSGSIVRVPPQALTVLTMLVRRPGELVTREEIQKQLWGQDTFVDFEQGLNHCIKQVRTALSDDAQSPRFVETLPRRGYRFIAQVTDAKDAARPPEAAKAADPVPPRRLVWALAAFGLLLALALAGWLVAGKARTGERRLIAVLPFENLTGDAAQDYISDGLTEELSSQIARLSPRLGVISRTSAFKYKGTGKGADQIGRELNAQYLVEGSVRQADRRLRITAQLIRVSDQSHVWADSYDRPLDSLLQVQAEVAGAIARTIDVSMAPRERQERDHFPDWRAYSAYLKGRHLLLDTKREHEIRLAVDYFKEAVALDPAYALPWAGLADAHSELAGFGAEPGPAYAAAKRATTEALRIDPQLAEAHVSLGRIAFFHDWDFRMAEDEFRAAIASKPTYEEGYHSYSHLLMALGRYDEATQMGQRVLELDPLSPHMNAHMGLTHLLAGRLDQSIAQLRKTIQLDSGYIRAWHFLGTAYEVAGDYPQAIATLRKAVALRAESSEGLAELAHALAASGQTGEARSILAQLEELASERYVSQLDFAAVRLALGERDRALDALERAVEERDPGTVYLAIEPYFRPLRGDPRFHSLVKRVDSR